MNLTNALLIGISFGLFTIATMLSNIDQNIQKIKFNTMDTSEYTLDIRDNVGDIKYKLKAGD